MERNTVAGGGVGFSGLLTIVFVVLKLTRVIDWSWWWVLSPVWIGAAISIAVIAIVIVVALIVSRGRY